MELTSEGPGDHRLALAIDLTTPDLFQMGHLLKCTSIITTLAAGLMKISGPDRQ